MTEEPKQDASTSEVSEHKDSTWGPGMAFFRDHPTLVVSLLYLYAAGIGIVYSLGLYRSFGINIFDYAEITDFLLAAFKDVQILILLVTEVVLVLVAVALGLLFKRTRAFQFWRRPHRFWLVILVYVVLMVWSAYGASSGTASYIKDGRTPAVDVWYRSFSGSAGQVKESDLRLIGATQKAAFFYDLNDKHDKKDNHTLVVPQSQIVSIEVPD